MRISETIQRKIEEFSKLANEHQVKSMMYNDFVGELMGVKHLLSNLEKNLKESGQSPSLPGELTDVPPSVYETHPSNTFWKSEDPDAHHHGHDHSHDHGHDHGDHDHGGMGHGEGRFGDGETDIPQYGGKGRGLQREAVPDENLEEGEALDQDEEINKAKAGSAPTPPDFVTF